MGELPNPYPDRGGDCTAPSRSSHSVNRTWVLAPRVLFNTKEFR